MLVSSGRVTTRSTHDAAPVPFALICLSAAAAHKLSLTCMPSLFVVCAVLAD